MLKQLFHWLISVWAKYVMTTAKLKNPTLEKILSLGYFPRELPPLFNTSDFATFCSSSTTQPFAKDTQSVRYRLARPHNMPRILEIPNPESYIILSKCICDRWSEITPLFSTKATVLSRPRPDDKERAIGRAYKFSSYPYIKLAQRTQGNYLLRTDISKFYPSIYTHSIPWSIDGKKEAKKREYQNDGTKLGNELDRLVRNCRHKETKGIPIGPDSSYVIGEIMMSSIDKALHAKGYKLYTRNTDDYEFITQTQGEAEELLAYLAKILSEFSLELNNDKTEIIELPSPLDKEWVTILVGYDLSGKIATSKLTHFFNRAFSLSKSNPRDSVLKFALSYILNNLNFKAVAPNTVLEFALQCALYEAGCLKHCFDIIGKCEERDFINYKKVLSTLERIIQKHAPLNHSSEVCWALWAINELSLLGMFTSDGDMKLSSITIDKLLESDDCCIITMSMYLHEKTNLLDGKINPQHYWYEILHNPDEHDSYWLYWYEGITRKWTLQSTKIPDNYHVLKKASERKISFIKE